jgi:TonB family protein
VKPFDASRKEPRALRLRTRSSSPADAPPSDPEQNAGAGDDFTQRLLAVAAIHVLLVLALFLGGLFQRKSKPEQIVWMDGGSLGAPAETSPSVGPETPAIPEPIAPDAEETVEPPLPEPAPAVPMPPVPELMAQPEPEPPAPLPEKPPSEIALTTPRPEPPATPKPKPTPVATPKPTPKATPKPTPKPAPKPTPKATPKPTPKPSPKATPKATPKASPMPSTPKPTSKAAGTPKPATTPASATAKPTTAADAKTKNSTPAMKTDAGSETSPGTTGNGKGQAKTGRGAGAGSSSDFGWYLGVIRDRFYSTWQQPTSIVRSSQEFTTRVKIRIGRDGTILARDIVSSSGNAVMDASVLEAANQVSMIDALPAGLGGEFYEVNIDFKLDQDN